MNKKDKEYLISAGILLFVGWFVAGLICYSVAFALCTKVQEKTTISTILKIISIVGASVMLLNLFSN